MSKTEKRELGIDQKPPLSWYCGFGNVERGITAVIFSNELRRIADGEVGRHLDEWFHHRGNSTSKRDPKARQERSKQILAEAEAFITQATGFTPREINAQRRKLEKRYRGQTTAPFEFELS